MVNPHQTKFLNDMVTNNHTGRDMVITVVLLPPLLVVEVEVELQLPVVELQLLVVEQLLLLPPFLWPC